MKSVNLPKIREGLALQRERERERERDCFGLPETSQAPDLNFFQFVIKDRKSAVVFTADFLFPKFMMGDRKIRLPYKDDDKDEGYFDNPDEVKDVLGNGEEDEKDDKEKEAYIDNPDDEDEE